MDKNISRISPQEQRQQTGRKDMFKAMHSRSATPCIFLFGAMRVQGNSSAQCVPVSMLSLRSQLPAWFGTSGLHTTGKFLRTMA
jgi:hypothetical protein